MAAGGVQVPVEYLGREQSYLKHRVLQEYLLGWGLKLGSVARERRVRLCYLDAFAGPWNQQCDDLRDTSIAIGLDALEAAAQVWRDGGATIDVEARFIEKDRRAFTVLEQYLVSRKSTIDTVPMHGEFGSFIAELKAWMGADAGLIFVDPKGWIGAAMRFIAPLVEGHAPRDVLINVMFDHINRFKDAPHAFLRDQMRDFFGLGDSDLPPGLDEEQLFALYREKLKERCGLRYAADLAIAHPTMDRTKFRLVVGGRSPAVLALFRDIEKKVIGAEAAGVREEAATREEQQRTGQVTLFQPPATDTHYEPLHVRALRDAPGALLSKLTPDKPIAFEEVWPALLESLHLTRRELAQAGWRLHEQGDIVIENAQPRERTLKDEHLLRRRAPGTPARTG